ncbi:hypothetical protein ACFWCA_19020 [Streptomyces phaeochromogenes]|uniref:hypothetical protein n=1 Tax=Streptomyces phaeochromogenes TaxID=1923 RepID=UPI003688D9AB
MKKAKSIECRATRPSDMWVAGVPQHGVYGHGRTLRVLRSNLIQGLALIGVTTEITLVPVSPELERLRRAEAAYEAALSDAVAALAAHGGTPRDIADATRVTTTRVATLRSRGKARRGGGSRGR